MRAPEQERSASDDPWSPQGPHRGGGGEGKRQAARYRQGSPPTIRRWTPLVVGLVLVGMTVLAAAALNRAADDREMDRFRREVQTTQDRIVGRVDMYVTALLAARATLSVIDPLDTEKMRHWIGQLGIPHRHPGVQGTGFAHYVASGGRQALIAEMQRRGQTDFHIWPGTAGEAACTVILVDPMEGLNRGGVGFDMCSEPVRRAAMEQARDTGMPTASDRVIPISRPNDADMAGFLVFVPVFRGGTTPATVEQRRQDLLGYVYARFRAKELFRGILGADQHPLLAFTIADPEGAAAGQLLYQSESDDDPRYQPRLAISITAPVAGRDWRMLFRSRPAFDALSTRQFIWYLLAAGLAVSLAVMLMLRAQVRARAQAEENEAWIRFAWEATAYAASSLDPLAMAESLARYCLPTLGEWCAMDVLDDDGKPSRVMLTPVDPAREELAAALRRYPLDGRAGPLVGQVLAEKQGLRFELNDQMLAAVAQDAAHLELMKRANMRGLMVVPLICRGRTLGWLSLLRAHPYSERDLAVLEDVGRRVAMALDNARLYDQAQDAVRTRDAFLAIAAHELKAPLTTLQLQAQGLQRMIGRDAPLDQMQLLQRTTIIDRQSKRLANLIDDMMDVSRVAAGRLTFNVQDVDLVQLVREVVERFEDESLQVGSSLEMDLPESAVGRWDRVRLDQVLTNLLSNALKYGEQQPVAIRVETSPGLVRVCVQDRGIGIAAENQGRIFERFERFVSGQHYVGFGLGLWITRQIVEAQGGHVLVESEPGQGSRFVVELPTGH